MLRMTPVRRDLLHTLEGAERPLTAQELHQLHPGYDLSTVYRALEYLAAADSIDTESFFGEERYYFIGKGHGHFLLCSSCHAIIPFQDCTAGEIQQRLEQKYGYHIMQHILTFQGICPHCRDAREAGI